MSVDIRRELRHLHAEAPSFFAQPELDRLYSMLLILAEDHAVQRERIDTLERLLAEQGVLVEEAIQRYQPSLEVQQQRLQAHQDFAKRLLEPLQQAFASAPAGTKP